MEFYSNGKLLLTGEYVVLNGALSLALPTIYGQHLKVKNNPLNNSNNAKDFIVLISTDISTLEVNQT